MGNSETTNAKETGEPFSPPFGPSDDSACGGASSALLTPLASNVEGNAYLCQLRQAIQRKYFLSNLLSLNNAEKECPSPDLYINKKISMFLNIIRSNPEHLHKDEELRNNKSNTISTLQSKEFSTSTNVEQCSLQRKKSFSPDQDGVLLFPKSGEGVEPRKDLVLVALEKARADMLAAIDVCLQEIPPVKEKEKTEKTKKDISLTQPLPIPSTTIPTSTSTTANTLTPPSAVGTVATTTTTAATPTAAAAATTAIPVKPLEKNPSTQKDENKEMTKEVVHSENSSDEGKVSTGEGNSTSAENTGLNGANNKKNESSGVPDNEGTNNTPEHPEGRGTTTATIPSSSSSHPSSSEETDLCRKFDRYDWRCLLLDIVDVLLAIDSTLYFEIFRYGMEQFSHKVINPPLDNLALPTTGGESSPADSSTDTSTSRGSKAQTSSTIRRKKNNSGAASSTRDSQGGVGGANRYPIEVYKTIDELLFMACSIATGGMLRCVLQHQIAALKTSSAEHDGTRSEAKEGAPRSCGGSDGERRLSTAGHGVSATAALPSSTPAPLIEWGNVVADLRKIFQGEHKYIVECVLCAAFLRDDGKEMMCCLIQTPLKKKVLQDAVAFTYSKKPKEDPPSGSPLGMKMGDGFHSLYSHLGGRTSTGSSSSSTSSCTATSSSGGVAVGSSASSSTTTAGGGHAGPAPGGIASGGGGTPAPVSASPPRSKVPPSFRDPKKMMGVSASTPPSLSVSGISSSSSSAGGGGNTVAAPALGPASPSRKPSPIVTSLGTTPSPSLQVSEHMDYLTGTSLDDLNEEVENNYQQNIANSWSEYLEKILLPSSEFNEMQRIEEQKSPTEKLNSKNNSSENQYSEYVSDAKRKEEENHTKTLHREISRTFCQIATAYFFCSDEWSVEYREKLFKMLEESVARKEAEERRGIGSTLSTSQRIPSEAPITLEGSGAIDQPGGSSSLVRSTSTIEQPIPPAFSDAEAGVELLREMEIRIFNMSWIAALHKKVEQCIAVRPPMLPVAKAYSEREWGAAVLFSDFRARQRALTSLIKYSLAAGLSQEARRYSLRHFYNEKNEWTQSNQTLFSAVHYLESMVQLAQAHAACHEHKVVVEIVQMVIPQANLCDNRLAEFHPLREDCILRFPEERAKVLRDRMAYLREGWRSHACLRREKEEFYFNEYLSVLRQLRSRYRETAIFDAQMERGHQLMQQKEYKEAGAHFFLAVQIAKKQPGAVPVTTTSRSQSEAEPPPSAHPRMKSSFHRNIHLQVAGSGNLTTEEENINHEQKENQVLECMWRLAESERLLALAYVSQAENEVFVPDRRLELSQAVNYAYAAQATLQKWQAKGGTPKRMLTAVPCILIVIGKSLLLLNQPKKAMLLLEPLIEEKPSSASIRPPMWKEVLQPTPEPLTAEDVVLRMDVNSVTIDVFQLYAQCVVQFDAKKALWAVDLVRQLLVEGDQWIQRVERFISEFQLREEKEEGQGVTDNLAVNKIPEPNASEPSSILPQLPPPLMGRNEELLGADLTLSNDDILERSQRQCLILPAPQIIGSQDKGDSIRVVLKSKSERYRALHALREGKRNICSALRDIEITKGDAYCKMKRWGNALHTFQTLVLILHDSIASGQGGRGYPSSAHYRTSAGPSLETPMDKTPLEDNNDPDVWRRLSSLWSRLLYGNESYESVSTSVDDQLGIFTYNELGDDLDNMDSGDDLVNLMVEEERVDHRAAANLILSKLATIFQAMGQVDKSIRYHKIVLEYSNKINSKLLEYKSLLHLARLYTAKNAAPESHEAWGKVSALAQVYGDKEVGRETMRNLITGHENCKRFHYVIMVAEELVSLARAAEGVEAAADTRFALEALAKAQLELELYDDCLSSLDEREKVQENVGEWSGDLYEMRSRAFLGQGKPEEAIKVLRSYVQMAKHQNKYDEVGRALYCLARTFASSHNEIRAQRCYVESIIVFSRLPNLTPAQKKTVLTSFRWLVNDFYLSEELVFVRPSSALPQTTWDCLEELIDRGVQNTHGSRFFSLFPGSSGSKPMVEAIENESGNLAVLVRKEERRKESLLHGAKKGGDVEDGSLGHRGLNSSSSSSGTGSSLIIGEEEEETGLRRGVPIEVEGGGLREMQTFPIEEVKPESGGRDSNANPGSKKGSISSTIISQLAEGKAGTLGHVSLCSRPAAVVGGGVTVGVESALGEGDRRSEDVGSEGAGLNQTVHAVSSLIPAVKEKKAERKEKHHLKVSTSSFTLAIATIEWYTQFLVQRTSQTCMLPFPYAPAEATDLAMMVHAACTFIFFFADHSDIISRYRIIIRPARSSFFVLEEVQGINMSRFLKAFSIANPAEETDSAEQDAALEHVSTELWDPVCEGLKRANSFLEDASCVFIITDASLYNIPFGSLISDFSDKRGRHSKRKLSRRKPAGVQCPLVMIPSLTHLLSHGMVCEGIGEELLKGKQFSRFAILVEESESKPAFKKRREVLSVAQRKLRGRHTEPTMASVPSSTTTVRDDDPLRELKTWSFLCHASKAQVLDSVRDNSTKVVLFESASLSGNIGVSVSDGVLSCEDIISYSSPLVDKKKCFHYSCDHVELAIVQDTCGSRPTEDQPGFPAALCIHAHCARVLRLEDISGSHVCMEHRKMIVRYFHHLERVLKLRLQYPFALALQMTIKEAWERGLPVSVCCTLTLMGAP